MDLKDLQTSMKMCKENLKKKQKTKPEHFDEIHYLGSKHRYCLPDPHHRLLRHSEFSRHSIKKPKSHCNHEQLIVK